MLSGAAFLVEGVEWQGHLSRHCVTSVLDSSEEEHYGGGCWVSHGSVKDGISKVVGASISEGGWGL